MIQIIQSSQFHGLPTEDLMAHMSKFIEYYGMLKRNGISKDVIRLLIFLFSITDRAEKWFMGLPSQSITIWDEMYTTFFDKNFSPTKVLQIRAEINSFYQRDDKNL